MSISSDSTRKAGPFTGTGAIVPLPFSFKVFTTADVLVIRTDLSGVESTLTLSSDYTVTLNSNQDSNPGGVVTPLIAPGVGYLTTLSSQVAAIQSVILTNTGGFFPTVLNDAMDRLTILVQQLKEQMSRAVTTSISSSISPATLASYIVSLYGNLANIISVAGNATNINSAVSNAANINTVAGNNTNVTNVGGNITNVNAVASNATNINAVNANAANINAVAANSTNINTVSANTSSVAALGLDLTGMPVGVDYGDLTPATNPAGASGIMATVYNNLTSINTAAANITAINAAPANAIAAGNSATAAAGSATAAAGSATSASSSATNTAALLASFRSAFLGSFASDSAAVSFASANSITLSNGIMYENNSTNPEKFRIYNGSSWQDYDSSAQVSQSAAALSATNAATSASTASTAATTATTQATNASNSATAAGTSATNASNSATAAGTSATNAATSATNAAASASSAAASAATGAQVFAAEATVASATTTDIGAATSMNVLISGTTAITSFGSTAAAGVHRDVRMAAGLTLTYNATSLILPGAANIVTAAGDCFEAECLGSGNWVVRSYQRASGAPLALANASVTAAALAATLDLGTVP